MVEVLSPDGVRAVQLKKAERVIRDAMRERLVNSWDGYSISFGYGFVRETLKTAGITSFNIPGWDDVFLKILTDYANSGWDVSDEGGSYVFRSSKSGMKDEA